MHISSRFHPGSTVFFLLAAVVLIANGCSIDAIRRARIKYRIQADQEAYDVIAERNFDPRWSEDDYGIEMDPRSRYHDIYDPDFPPIPRDDPGSHQYMHFVDGKAGWDRWSENGSRIGYENPDWRGALTEYVDISEDGLIKLNVDTALKLAYVHAPSYQGQLETLYLSSLDVTAERFHLDTQFFGGYDTFYDHNGSLLPAAFSVDSLGNTIVVPAADGTETNRLTVGRASVGNPALQARRRFATAGELLVGFANSFVFEFTGSGANLASSLANFSIVQPLLRGSGKSIALEQLTLVERNLLANLRSHRQYRQGFYTRVAIGELGVAGSQRGGRSTYIEGYSGESFVGGYLGLLQQLQKIRNSEDNLTLQLRTLEQLEALLDVGIIDLVQVDQFRQSVEKERANLLQNHNRLQLSLDRFKTGTLGLPPDLPIQLDDSFIHQFQLVDREATAIQDTIIAYQGQVGEFPDDASVAALEQVITDVSQLMEPVKGQLEEVGRDLDLMDQSVPTRELTMADEKKKLFSRDREQLRRTVADLLQRFEETSSGLKGLQEGLSEQTRLATQSGLVVWLGDLLRLVQRSVLVQARARLETVTIETIELESGDAFEIALGNRLDFMNARAALVDSWRLVQVKANALESVLNVTTSGDIRTARNNPVSFRAPTGSLQLGLEFDAPFTRLLERNDYRETLIQYQRSRRTFIQSQDSVHQGLRALLRQIEQLRTNLEIQRRAVAIAIRRVDLTRAQLYAPVPPAQPGQRAAQFGPTATINLLSALSSLRDTQNNFLDVWLEHYAARMRLSRELGTMLLDEDGQWMDEPLSAPQEEIPPAEDDPAAEEP